MYLSVWSRNAAVCALCALCLLAGCARSAKRVDPFEKSNRFVYRINDGLDRVALKPASNLYVKVLPKPVRRGLGNAFDNLGYGNVIVCDLAAGKLRRGLGDLGRMAVNSTLGLAGLFDVAVRFGLPKHENDFGIALGQRGVGPGPYLMLPLLGPSTLRDLPGLGVQMVTNPIYWLNPPLAVTLPLGAVNAVDERSRADKAYKFRNQAALDPYVFTRDAYLQYRQGLIREGKPPADQGLYDDEAVPASAPASQPSPTPAPQEEKGGAEKGMGR